MGLRKSAAVNTASLEKLGWKILTQPDNFWVQQIRAKYGPPEQFFDSKAKQTDSWVWKCLLRLRPFIKQGIRWKVGNGRTINFWTDIWCADETLASILNVDLGNLPETDLKVSELYHPGEAMGYG